VVGASRTKIALLSDASLGGTNNFLRQYLPVATWAEKKGGKNSAHIQFVNCGSIDELVDFVGKFGPVWGQVVHRRDNPDGTENLSVKQSLKALVQEHRQFWYAFELLLLLKRRRLCRANVEKLASLVVENPESDRLRTFRVSDNTLKQEFREGTVWKSDLGAWDKKTPIDAMQPVLRALAHATLCQLFNRFPLTIVPFGNKPVEVPVHRAEGIRPMLYYMLRRDYLDAENVVARCANDLCKSIFAAERRGQKFCCPECSKQQRGRRYWHRSGKILRAMRRAGG